MTFITTAGTATAGVDYTSVNVTISLPAGVTVTNIAVPLIDDFLAENNETVNLRLTNATGAGAFLLSPTNAVLRIVDNDRIGSLDSAFNPLLGANGTVNALVVQPDGRVLIGGNFTSYEGVTINRIARVNVDGTLDASFNPGLGFDNIVYALALQPDGKVVVGGTFQNAVGFPQAYLARLNPDGTRDVAFGAGLGPNGVVLAVELLGNGSMIIGGNFTRVDALSRTNVARLTTNGVADATFAGGAAGANGPVFSIKAQADQKILLGGVFTSVNGVTHNGLARLNSDGSSDASYAPVLPAGSQVYSIALQANGLAVVGGSFSTVNGGSHTNLVRMNIDGTADNTFNVGAGPGSTVRSVALDSGGRVIIGGDFVTFNGTARSSIARVNADGSLDAGFDPGLGADAAVQAVASEPQGHVWLAGDFVTVDGIDRGNVARLNGDHGVVQLTSAAVSVLESTPTLTLTISRTGGSSAIGTIDFVTSNLTATAGLDYVATNGTLTFFAGVTNLTVTLAILPDKLVEGNEDFNFVLRNPVSITLGAQTNTVVTINDDDSTFQFSTNAVTVIESLGTVTLTITRTGNLNSIATVPYSTTNGTAIAGSDFTGVTNTVLTFGTNQGSTNIVLTILNDTVVEPTETFTVGLGTPVGEASIGATRSVTVTILDDDSTIQFNTNAVSVYESLLSIVTTVTRTGYLTSRVDVAYSTTNGTALAGSDFVAVNNAVISFGTNVSSLTITNIIINDTVVEPTETFTVGLAVQSGEASLGTNTFTTVTILDDDSTLQFSSPVASVVEAVGTVSLTVTRTGYSNSVATVLYNTTNGTALAGSDYTGVVNGLITFGSNVISQVISITILNDTIVEPTETFTVGLSAPTGQAALGAPAVATVTVTDDDSTVQFSAPTATVTEAQLAVTLTIVRTGDLNSSFTVNYSTTNGTALAGSDFVAVANAPLTFGTNQASTNIIITILNDKVIEPTETFTVGLGIPTGQAALGVNKFATVTILDDDSTLQFTVASTNVIESAGSVTLTVTRTGASNSTVTVPFTTANGSALQGADYAGTNNTLTFGTNVLSQTITVPILNDKVLEGTETFTVNLGVPGGEAALGSPNAVVVTILDDESILQFSTIATTVLESGTNVVLTVTRTGAKLTTVTLPYAFINGSATNGVDYTGVPGTLTFGTNIGSQTLTIPIANDRVIEANKTFSVQLSAPGGEAILGTNTIMIVTIIDDDSLATFATPNLSVREDVGSISVNVQRIGYTNIGASVTVVSSNATGVGGVDFATVNTNIFFNPGEILKTFTVAIINDLLDRGTRTFDLRIVNPVGEISIGSASNLTVTITDDDFRLVIPAGVSLVAGSESFLPANNAIDPFETVTVNFSLRNTGTVNATNVVATLLVTNGVTAPSGPQNYGTLTNNGSVVSRQFTFTASATQSVTAVLQLTDSGLPIGTATFMLPLGVTSSYTNSTNINIPLGTSLPSIGAADVYPSSIIVSNATGVVNRVTVTLNSFTHTWPADVALLLVSPRGQKLLLMENAGGGFSVTNLSLTFDDAAATALPELSRLASQSYRPTNYPPNYTFPAPAPAGPYANKFASLAGINPNGTWSLYVADDTAQNNGAIRNGWTLSLNTVVPQVDLGLSMVGTPEPVGFGSNVVYTLTVTNKSTVTAVGAVVTNPIPVGANFVSAVSSAGTVSNAAGVLTFRLGDLTNNATATISIVTTPTVVGLVTNTATVSSQAMEQTPGDNTATWVTTVNAPGGLLVTTTDSPDPVTAGLNVTYTTIVSNRGPIDATSAFLTNTFPAGATFVSASASQGSFSRGSNVVVFTIGALANASSATLTVVVSPPGGGTITNRANAVAVPGSLNTPNAATTNVTTVNSFKLLSATKSGGSFSLNLSGVIGHTYVLQFATNVTVPMVWAPIATNTPAADGTLTLTDPAASTSRSRFYRVIEP